jgi:hypothetical protein
MFGVKVSRAAYSGACCVLAINSTISAHCPLTLNDDIPGLDGDLDPLGDLEQFLGVAVPYVSPCPPNLEMLCGQARMDLRAMRMFGRVVLEPAASWSQARETYMYFILRVAVG